MNTVKVGDDFEKKSKEIIKRIIDNYELSSIPAHCTIREKAKYPSYKRSGKKITFDLAIEVKNPQADKPILIYIIECKNLKGPVPVDDVEEFNDKVGGILGVQTKKILIAKNGFQSGVLDIADNLGVMLVEVREEDYKIILHKSDKIQKTEDSIDIDKEIIALIRAAFFPSKIKGLKKLSSDQINEIAVSFLNDFNKTITENVLPVPISELVKYLEEIKLLKVNSKNNLKDDNGNELLGYFDLNNNSIYINHSIQNTIRFPFVLAHEIGHFVLHSNLRANQFIYDNFKDSEYSLFIQKHKLINDKNWIEWQANCFAACLLMPKESLITKLVAVQMEKGISKQGRIYLDGQNVNQKDYIDIIEKLGLFFGVSKTSVEYRLESLNIIERPLPSKATKETKKH